MMEGCDDQASRVAVPVPAVPAAPAAGDDGRPSFTKIIIDPNPGSIPVEKLMADLNGDGKLDIIVGLEQAGLYWWGSRRRAKSPIPGSSTRSRARGTSTRTSTVRPQP
jgi:hypothetical protein